MHQPDFGPALQRLREARGLNRKELAQRAEVDASTITRLESGERGVKRELAERLARALEISGAEEVELLRKAGFLADDASELLAEPELARLATVLGDPRMTNAHRELLLRHVELALDHARALGYRLDDPGSSTTTG